MTNYELVRHTAPVSGRGHIDPAPPRRSLTPLSRRITNDLRRSPTDTAGHGVTPPIYGGHMISPNRAAVAAIMSDPSAPASLRDAITDALEVYARAVDLFDAIKVEARADKERLKAVDASEPARLVDELTRGPVEVDDVLPDHTEHLNAAQLSTDRLRTAHRTVHYAADRLARDPYVTAAADILEWVVDLRSSTPWPAALPDHVVTAWNACPITWTLPGLPRTLRFGRLPVSPGRGETTVTTNVHRLAWEYLAAGACTVASTESGRIVVTITADWSAVLDALVTV